MELVIVTGMSGSGKSTAINVMEDIGFYCMDNIPPQLIRPFAMLCKDNETITKAALVIDIRGGSFFLELSENIELLKKEGFSVKVLYLDADHKVIETRYKETRRMHPLYNIAGGDIAKAIEAESDILAPVKEQANYYVDTSLMGTSKLKENIRNIFVENLGDNMMISCLSFGYKYGMPNEADLVFDVRCLPNPFYVPQLKEKTGISEDVQNFVMKHEKAKQLEQKLEDLLDFLIPEYIAEGKSQLVIAFGCTGGRHRSVTFAENMYKHLLLSKLKVRILHRDIGR